MARMPGARWLGEHSPGRKMLRYDIVCLHTIVGNAPAHAAHFSVHHDGRIDQSRDTRFQSGANLNGNHRVIAIENEDHGPGFKPWNVNDGHAVPAFTDAQVEANAKILAWAHRTHGVPLQLCPNSRSTSRGLAYHRQGIDGNFGDYAYPGRVAGGETWTNSRGKVCPGDRRISARDRILARAKQIVSGTTPPQEDDFMGFIDNQAEFDQAMSRWWNRVVNINGAAVAPTPETARLRGAPIQQVVGRVQPDGSFINVHTVMGEAHALAQSFGINNADGPHPLLDALLAANDDAQTAEVLAAVRAIEVDTETEEAPDAEG